MFGYMVGERWSGKGHVVMDHWEPSWVFEPESNGTRGPGLTDQDLPSNHLHFHFLSLPFSRMPMALRRRGKVCWLQLPSVGWSFLSLP